MVWKFKDELVELGVGNEVVTKGGTRGRWDLNSPMRISNMAGIRNKVLEPLHIKGNQDGRGFEKVGFFNNVYFDWSVPLPLPALLGCDTNSGIGSIVHLIKTKDGDYDLACALDFDGVGMYDMCISASSVCCIANVDPFTFMTPRWVLRNACSSPTKEVWPYVPYPSPSSPVTRWAQG